MAASRPVCHSYSQPGRITLTKTIDRSELGILTTTAFVAIFLLPCLNAFVPPGSTLHVSNFSITVHGKYLCYAVLSLSVNLHLGYTGLLSLLQSLFFPLGR